MGKIDIKASLEINTSADKAWEIIGPNFVNIAVWGRTVLKSWENDSAPKTIKEAPAKGRFCEVRGFGKMEENILHYDAKNREITWSAQGEKLPGFLNGLQNELSVESTGENTCLVHSNITAKASGIQGALLGGVMKKNFTKLIHGFLGDWKAYAETGKVSETKQRELAKFSKNVS